MKKTEIASVYLRLLEEVNTTIQIAMETLHEQATLTRVMMELLIEGEVKPTADLEGKERFYDGDDEIEL